jgi:hypothetical protein
VTPADATPSPDATRQEPDAAPTVSILGAWEGEKNGNVYWRALRYEFLGGEESGTIEIQHEWLGVTLHDTCELRETATGTWEIASNHLDVTVVSGRTRMFTKSSGIGDCSLAYAERDMTTEELRNVDVADGEFHVDDKGSLWTFGADGQWVFDPK